ncbi:MAG: DUF2089 family protein [Limisphaerales bacterium]
MQPSSAQRAFEGLDDEDFAFIKRFILASGSLKELAAAYGVSYPTVRLRLDRLIQKFRILDESRDEDTYERLLRIEFAEGRFDASTFHRLLTTYQKQKGTP